MMADQTNKEGLAVTRDRRSNAGARMSRLIEAEDDDDFYKTTYGGFEEEADDFDYKSEESGSDITDSDIDINEDDELKSDAENDKECKDKKKSSHAYKEPKKTMNDTEQTPKPKPERVKQEKLLLPTMSLDSSVEKKALRKSTADKSKSTEGSIREREAKAALLKQMADRKKVAEVRRLTQEELLAEAKITEEINLASLETYQKMELEKKRVRVHRQTNNGPLIRFHSVTVPLVDVPMEPEINVDGETIESFSELKSQPQIKLTTEKCSRNFITFTDDRIFRKYFPTQKSPRPASKHMCPVTGLPAKYFDPLTQSPYATAEAFKIIREAYQQKQDSGLDGKRRSRSGISQS